MLSPIVLWPSLAGSALLLIGLAGARKELKAAAGLDKLIVLGPVFVAASLAAFGAEHLAASRSLMQLVPPWMPVRLFWAYFVGVALLAAALSLALGRYVRWSAFCLAAMFFLFVLMLHLPGVLADPANRISWAVLLRDTAFGGGALAARGESRWLMEREYRCENV